MSGSWDITIYPAENGYSVQLDIYSKSTPTLRYNAATVEEALAWIGQKIAQGIDPTPEVTP